MILKDIVLVMTTIACSLVIVLFLMKYKDKIDNYSKLQIEWIGVLAYGKQYISGWAGYGSMAGTIDGEIKLGLRSDGVLVFQRVPKEEGKK